MMQRKIAAFVLAAGTLFASAAQAHGELSALSALSALPLASVVTTGSAAVALPVALSTAGAVLVVKSVEVSARGTLYVLERAADGALVSVEIAARGAEAVSLTAGTAVTVSVLGAGVLLSAAGEVLAFIPNALGQALLHNERLTY